jgi:hypothetical protein
MFPVFENDKNIPPSRVATAEIFPEKETCTRGERSSAKMFLVAHGKRNVFWEGSARVTHGRNPRFDGRGCFDPGEAISRACGREDQMPRFVAQQDVDATFSRTIQTLEANSEGAALGFTSNRSCAAAARQVPDIGMTRQLAAMRRED